MLDELKHNDIRGNYQNTYQHRADYKSINTYFQTSKAQVFALQFHISESFNL